MSDQTEFGRLLNSVRKGNADAIAELVRTYESDVRLAVRSMLTQPRMRAQFDSGDVVQSVLLRFCLKAVEGSFDIDNPAQLVGLLKKIAYYRFLNKVEYAQAQERDVRRLTGDHHALVDLFQEQAGPCTIAGWRDEHREICRRLTDGEEHLAKRWARGETWVEIAGGDEKEQDRLRHQMHKAWRRVAEQLTQVRGEPISVEYVKAVFQWAVECQHSEAHDESACN